MKNSETIIERLKDGGILIQAGLSNHEISEIEGLFKFTFPPDYKDLLIAGVPAGEEFIDWRGIPTAIQERLDWPKRGILFDVEYNEFWMDEWGEKPSSLLESLQVAGTFMDTVPKMIPIYSHRYIPELPKEEENPIFSIYQADIIYYGSDLLDYFQNEFQGIFGRTEYQIPTVLKRIPFWSLLV